MKLVYATEKCSDYSNSIFLAGPTRRSEGHSWRSDFIKLLPESFNGTLLIPEARDGIFKSDYIDQVEWEYVNLHNATTIVFWVPRDLETLPGFTTNVEFGMWIKSEKIIYGRPDNASKINYLDWLYEKIQNKKPCSSLEDLIKEAVLNINDIITKLKISTSYYEIERLLDLLGSQNEYHLLTDEINNYILYKEKSNIDNINALNNLILALGTIDIPEYIVQKSADLLDELESISEFSSEADWAIENQMMKNKLFYNIFSKKWNKDIV